MTNTSVQKDDMHRYALYLRCHAVTSYRPHALMDFPFISFPAALRLLRIVTAILFAAHAGVRIVHNTIVQFGTFMETTGFAFGTLWVWGITITELVAALLLVANRFVRPAAAALFIIAFTGIILIHRHLGWFVGEHGTGGSEYSVALMMLLLVIAAADRESRSKDAAES